MQYQTLKPDRILETQRRLSQRIAARFPRSGLSEVGGELVSMAEEAAVRAEKIRRPNLGLRAAVVLLLLGALALGLWMAAALHLKPELPEAMSLFQFAEAVLRACVFLGAVILFLLSLEIRLKRRRALAALHELRAMAHVVDMHQVAKDPERFLHGESAVSEGPSQTTKTIADLNRYLHYCNELVAIISKIAALYVQEFPDAPTVSAVDQVENLCSGLSQRIWQKIMILDQFVEQQKPARPAP
ncbi:MAG TPA: hypothetical protein VG013_21875 [Gemmataceae bacterium]|nr:hypothetical protein [Gemmataceae bacterium]